MFKLLRRALTNIGDSVTCLIVSCVAVLITAVAGVAASLLTLTNFSDSPPFSATRGLVSA